MLLNNLANLIFAGVGTMIDFMRESFSYWGLYKKMLKAEKMYKPFKISFGVSKEQYFLFYEPSKIVNDKVIVWVHGGGWNAGSPDYFDFVGQCVAKAGYRFVSLGYRLSPKNKYPSQMEDICMGYKRAIAYLNEKGINTSKVIVSGPSAGAHLSSILCYCKEIQKQADIDVSNIIGFIGVGGPYSFSGKQSFAIKILLNQLFARGYDRMKGEPCFLMEKSHIPMLLIQSKHDGLIEYSCAEKFYKKAKSLGIKCELYTVADKKNTHSWYTAGMFLENRREYQTLDKFFSGIENLQ